MDEKDEVQTKVKLLTQDEGRWSKSRGGEAREIMLNWMEWCTKLLN
jgi:hypothetical protein